VKLLDLQVNTFSQAFGIVRDIDVWIEYLTEASGFMQGYPSFTRYLSSQKLRRIKCAAEAKEFLSSKEYSSLAQSISLFLRASIPDIIQQKSDANSAKFAAKAIERQLEKLSKLDADIPKNTDAAHSFRKICRKSRYTAEFLTSAAGCTSFLRLPADTKKMSAILGEIHDRDVGISLVSRCRWKGCTRLAAKLESERNALFKQAASCWSMIQRNYLLKGKAV
jgi:CHAD domain-containing protein